MKYSITKLQLVILMLIAPFSTNAAAKEKSYNISGANMEIATVIKKYSDMTGEKFILDSNVRGKMTIYFPGKTTKDEAFNALAKGLAINGLTYVKHQDYYTVRQARAAQRTNLPVTSELPPENPVRMITWVYKCKNVKCEDVYKNLRMLNSKDGETFVDPKSNKLIMTDYSDHFQKVAKILAQVDVD